MKIRRSTARFAWLLLAVAALSTSCRKDSASPGPSASAGDIRGEPIRAPVATNTTVAATAATQTVVSAGSPSVAPASAARSSAPPAREVSDEPLVVGFDKLASFTYEMPDDINNTNAVNVSKSSGQIPESVRGLDKKNVALKGFMLPLKVEGGLVTELLIMRDQSMCCYGTVPKITEWVSVKMNRKGVKPIMDQPVTLFGTLHVGEIRENGYLVGIYHLDGERMVGPLDM